MFRALALLRNRTLANYILPLILFVAILLRAVAAIALGDDANPVSGAYDQVSYDVLAQRVLAGYGFSFPVSWYPFTAAGEQTAHWSFLYTIYLAGVYALFGHHPLAARLTQALIAGLQCYLAYRIGRRVFSEWVGLTAAALTAGYAYFIFFNAVLMTQTFYILAVLLALAVALDLADNPNPRFIKWIALGVAFGVGALMRQTILFFAPVLILWLWWARRKVQPGSRSIQQLSRLLVPVVVIALFVLPWTIRNYLVYDDFLLLNSNGGFWLYSSNHPNQGTDFNPNYVAPIPKDLEGLSEPAIDRALYQQAVGFILSDPLRFGLLSINRLKDYFWLGPSEQSSFLSNVSRLLSFTLYAPFMLLGLLLSLRQWRVCLPLYLYVVFDTAFCLMSWAAPRYRLPSDAIMMIFAGLAVVTLGRMVVGFRWLSSNPGVSPRGSERG